MVLPNAHWLRCVVHFRRNGHGAAAGRGPRDRRGSRGTEDRRDADLPCLPERALPTDSIRANNSLERVIHDIRRRTRVAHASPDGNLAVMARSGCRDTDETTILRAAAALAVVMLFAGPVVARTAPALEWQEGRAPERRYTGEMLKALPAKAVARWLQVESRVDTLIELAVASQIPLVYAAPRVRGAAGCPPGGSVGCEPASWPAPCCSPRSADGAGAPCSSGRRPSSSGAWPWPRAAPRSVLWCPRPRVRVIGSLDGRAVRTLFEAISCGSVVLDLRGARRQGERGDVHRAPPPRALPARCVSALALVVVGAPPPDVRRRWRPRPGT